jgi:hypothetical protein
MARAGVERSDTYHRASGSVIVFRRSHALHSAFIFRPSGLISGEKLAPTACAVGCILSPLRGCRYDAREQSGRQACTCFGSMIPVCVRGRDAPRQPAGCRRYGMAGATLWRLYCSALGGVLQAKGLLDFRGYCGSYGLHFGIGFGFDHDSCQGFRPRISDHYAAVPVEFALG